MNSDIPKPTKVKECIILVCGCSHNWTKNIFGFFILETQSIETQLYVYRKNVFENVFHTIMDDKGKTRDDEKARLDLKKALSKKGFMFENKF